MASVAARAGECCAGVYSADKGLGKAYDWRSGWALYWLALHAGSVNYDTQQPGSKTADLISYPDAYAGNHFMDDGVFY